MDRREFPMRAHAKVVSRLGLVVSAAFILSATVAAQTGLATVTGIVSDASGGAIPGLTVSAVNQATKLAYTGVANGAGNYIITGIPIGTYVISAQLQGFKGAQSRVTLSAAQTARLDFKLEVGDVEERIDVVANSVL